MSADGRRAISASYDDTLKVWDVDRGNALATFTCDAAVIDCALCDSGKMVAGDAGGRIYVLEMVE
jgi:WD40 repeat protein